MRQGDEMNYVDVQEPSGAEEGAKEKRSFCPVVIDEERFRFEHSPVTGGELMDAAGIPRSVGLLRILPDGTQEQFSEGDELELPHAGEEPCGHFMKRVRFKRG